MFLQRDGFTILERNWRFQKKEVDIIAQKDEFLIFIDVKTRRSKKLGKPSASKDEKKITVYKDAAEKYLEQCTSDFDVRFDIVNIIIGKDENEIEHITDVF